MANQSNLSLITGKISDKKSNQTKFGTRTTVQLDGVDSATGKRVIHQVIALKKIGDTLNAFELGAEVALRVGPRADEKTPYTAIEAQECRMIDPSTVDVSAYL